MNKSFDNIRTSNSQQHTEGSGQSNARSKHEDQKNNVEEITFCCYKCGLQETCQYFGCKPPFVKNQVRFAEDSFVMRDPFSPREAGRAHFLLIGGKCGKCKKTVCIECSIFYSKRFCYDCCSQYLSEFPPEIGTKVQKKLSNQQ